MSYYTTFKRKYEKCFSYSQTDIDNLGNNSFELVKVRVPKSEIIEREKSELHFVEQILLDFKVKLDEAGLEYDFDKYGRIFFIRKEELIGIQEDLTSKAFEKLGEDYNRLQQEYPIQALKRIEEFILYILELKQTVEKECNGLKKGEEGEAYVSRELEFYRSKYKIAENILLPADEVGGGETSETDVYIVTSKGIFVCEVKNRGNANQIIRIGSDGQWKKYSQGYKLLDTMESPVLQNNRYCLVTESFLKKNGITDYQIYPLIIIANDSVFIDNNSKNAVIRMSELYTYIEELDAPEKYNEDYQNKIINLFHHANVKERKFDCLTLSNQREEIYQRMDALIDYFKAETVFQNKLREYVIKSAKHAKIKYRLPVFILAIPLLFLLMENLICFLPFLVWIGIPALLYWMVKRWNVK